MRYRSLESNEIVGTITTLHERICARFPHSDLAGVCEELVIIAKETESKSEYVNAPNYPLRFIILALIAAVGGLFYYGFQQLQIQSPDKIDLVNLFQGVEAATNLLVITGAAIFFLITIEARMARTSSLRDLNELRSIIHVIDMHQLNKDPSELFVSDAIRGGMSRADLTRYLGYCSVMLSLGAKLAALYAQKLPDAVVIDASSDIQNVAGGLSLKIWQKIAILESYEEKTTRG
jgi:hypothetical protein